MSQAAKSTALSLFPLQVAVLPAHAGACPWRCWTWSWNHNQGLSFPSGVGETLCLGQGMQGPHGLSVPSSQPLQPVSWQPHAISKSIHSPCCVLEGGCQVGLGHAFLPLPASHGLDLDNAWFAQASQEQMHPSLCFHGASLGLSVTRRAPLLCCRRNLSLVKELGDRAAQGRAYGNLGNTQYLLGNFSEAIAFHKEVGESWWVGVWMLGQADVCSSASGGCSCPRNEGRGGGRLRAVLYHVLPGQ